MSPKALYGAAAALGCLGLLALVAGGVLTATGLARLNGGGGGEPTAADVEAAIRQFWERPDGRPPTGVELHDVELGDSHTANEQDEIDGVPPGGVVTAARVDFTVRSYYDDETQAVRRKMEAKVYRDAFGNWRVMNSGSFGEDQITREPPR
jgi:hypothetical protein